MTVTMWESLDAIRGFAGEDCEAAHVAPCARESLSHFDARCLHYEVAFEDTPKA